MRNLNWFVVFAFFLLGVSVSAEDFEPVGPEKSRLGQMGFRSEDKIQLVVPKTFEGRTVKEWRKNVGIELFEGIRFERQDSKVQLRGLSTIFDFDVRKDKLDFQIHTSRALRPGMNACMDCHQGRVPRTTFIIGQESARFEPKPVTKGNITFTIDEVSMDTGRFELNHWLRKRLMVRAEGRSGIFRQADLQLKVAAASFGLAGMLGHRFQWEGRAILSKMATYSKRRTLTGRMSYRFGKRLKVGFSAGAFLDGYTQFGTEMSDMGAMTVKLAKEDPQLMPTLFTKLKNERFGYVQTSIEYEYPF
ncbi:hypothetical protein AUK22_11790 [bacterium CG2_30_54_10]|nr:MAG: hypothetical protein AUK22_11790 [bacterium CG2_30_54_10]